MSLPVSDIPKKPRKPRLLKRANAKISLEEKNLVAQFVMDQPREIAPQQINALATVLRRPKETVKAMVEQARENFVASAEYYVEAHKRAVDTALTNGDSKSLEVAVRGSQWAMENMSIEGTRIVEKAVADAGGTKIMIGVQIGGLKDIPAK